MLDRQASYNPDALWCLDMIDSTLRHVPLVHLEQMRLLTMYDNMRALLKASELLVGQNAGKLKYGVFEWVEPRHFEIYPQICGLKGQHYYDLYNLFEFLMLCKF